MWGVFFTLLILVAIADASVKSVLCPPEIIFKQENIPECNQVCETAREKAGFQVSKVLLSPAGGQNQDVPVAKICVCKLADDENNPYKVGMCAYQYSYDPLQAAGEQFNLSGLGGDIPGQLVKLFTFRGGNVSLHDTGALVLSGFYSAYVEAIRGWTSFFALALVVIIAGWNMALPGATTLIQKIRQKETEMQAISAAEIIKTAMAVIPAVGFFALPVPVGEDMIFMGGVKPGKGSIQIVGVSQKPRNTQDTQDGTVAAYLNESLCVYYQEQAEYYEERAQMLESTDPALAQQYRVQAGQYRKQAEDCKKNLSGDRQREESQREEAREPDHWSRPRFVLYRGEQNVYMPLAVGLVGSFIEFGVEGANAVSRVVNNVIIEYQIMKLTKSGSALGEAKQKLKQWKEGVENVEKELEKIQGSASDCGVSSCNGVLQKLYDANLSAECRDVLHIYAAYCNSVFVYKQNNSGQQQPSQRSEDIAQSVRSVAQNVGSSFSWLSPAVNTQAVLYALFVQMSAKEDKEVKLKRVYAMEYAPPSSPLEVLKYGLHNIGDIPAVVGKTIYRGVASTVGGVADQVGSAMNVAGGMLDTAKTGGLEIGLSKPDWFVYGSALTISSLPPAAQIKNMIASMGQWASGLMSKIITVISTGLAVAGLGIPALFVGGTAAGLTSLAGSVISVLGGIAVAYGAGLLFWSAAPNLVVSAVTIMHFIGYLFDIAKFMLTLPFFAVGAATRRPETTLQFFGHTLKLTTTPLLIALMPLVAFVAIELVVFFFFIVPSTLILAGVSAADSVMAYFLGGMAVGFMFIVAHILGVIVAWDVSTGFIEGIYSYVNNMIQAYQSSSPQLAGGVKGVVISKLTSGGR